MATATQWDCIPDQPIYLGWLYKSVSSGNWTAILGTVSRPDFQVFSNDLEYVLNIVEKRLGRKIKLQGPNEDLGYRIY